MDSLAELRDVWHRFAAGQIGPEAVVAAAQRACGAGIHRQAPSLAQLANLQPTQYGWVSEIFGRVRVELQNAAAQAAPQRQAAYAAGGAMAVAQPAGYAAPVQSVAVPPVAAPAYAAPVGYPAPQAYAAPPLKQYPPAAPGLPAGVHGISRKELKELRRTGWVCVIAGFVVPLVSLVSVVNGMKLSKHGDSHGTAMTVAGAVLVTLTVLGLMAVLSSV